MSRAFAFTESLSYLIWEVARILGSNAGSLCKLETTDGQGVFVTQDGMLMSLLRINGLQSTPTPSEYSQILDRLANSMNTAMLNPGHHLQMTFLYDPGIRGDLEKAMAPAYETINRLGMNAEGVEVIDDWRRSIGRYIAYEQATLAVWSDMKGMAKASQKQEIKNQSLLLGKQSWKVDAQTINYWSKRLYDNHVAFVKNLCDEFSSQNISTDWLRVHEGSNLIRRSLFPKETSKSWKPVLAGDKLRVRGRDQDRVINEGDYGVFMPDPLYEQLIPSSSETLGERVKIGSRQFATVSMTHAPADREPFNNLFRRLMNRGMPWVISFHMTSGAKDRWVWGLKRSAAALTKLTSSNSKRVSKSISAYINNAKRGDAHVDFKVCAATWVTNNDQEELARRESELLHIIQGWGSSDAVSVDGDPEFGVYSAFPGWTNKCPAPPAFAPLRDVLYMLPWARPAMPWKSGSMILRSPDGKVMPYALGSSLQTAWIDAGVAPMGYGKSVLLAAINLAFCLAAGAQSLPYLSVLDIGPSSRGLIRLLQALLPQDQRHLAIYRRLRLTPEDSINVFDTPLGCTEPTPNHRAFLINFLSLLATPVGQSAPYEGVSGIAAACIDAAYKELSPKHNPKKYVRHIESGIDSALDRLNIDLDEQTSWHEVTEYLFDAGETHLAFISHRYAVPLLSEVAAMARRDVITGSYSHVIHGEKVTDFFWRSMMEGISLYPILKDPTRLDLGMARVISLDLDEVCPKGQGAPAKQTAVMFMLARHVTASRFFEMPADVAVMPSRYQSYHEARIEELREQPKRMAWDEFHRVSTNAAVSGQVVGDVEVAIRESRKWNLHIGLYSQSIKDIPEVLLNLSTAVFVLGAGMEQDVVNIRDALALSDGATNVVRNLTKPRESGATFLGVFKTSSGDVVQPLTNTLGQMAFWAFSTTTEDVAIRDKLCEIVGYFEGLRKLSIAYPGGTKSRVEELKELASQTGLEEEQDSIINRIVTELVKQQVAA